MLKDYLGTISDCNMAIEINPKLGLAYSNRGEAKNMVADKNGGCLDFNKALELGHAAAADLKIKFCQ